MGQKLLRHVVLFKFKDEIGEEQLKVMTDSFKALEEYIDCVISIEWGEDISPEGLSKGYTHCFIVTFGSEADRDMYLTHPKHLSFVNSIESQLGDACVVDFWVA